MGLDMNLYKVTYVTNWDFHKPEQKWNITVTQGGNPSRIRSERISYITEEIAYWRKFNALHAFIVNNFADGKDECQKIVLYDEELKKIHDTLKTILDDTSLASQLMPPSQGFFFGTYEIDEWYWKDVENAYKVFSEILSDGEETREYYYQASW
jgi:hypothetical protein